MLEVFKAIHQSFYMTIIAQKIKFSIKDLFSKCDQISTEKMLNGKFCFLCSVSKRVIAWHGSIQGELIQVVPQRLALGPFVFFCLFFVSCFFFLFRFCFLLLLLFCCFLMFFNLRIHDLFYLAEFKYLLYWWHKPSCMWYWHCVFGKYVATWQPLGYLLSSSLKKAKWN